MPDDASTDPTVALFEQAVRTHTRRLLAIARGIVGTRASPEDVVQQALMNLYEHRQRYDWRQPGGLMRRTVVNESLRLLRTPRMAEVGDDHAAVRGERPDEPADRRESVARVREAIAKLPDHFRAALVLCEYEELAYEEISELLGVTVSQVKTWLHRGRKQLAAMLEDMKEP